MKNRVALMVMLGLGLCANGAQAALIGTSVTGALRFTVGGPNFYDPANGFVPPSGFLNTSGTTVTVQEPGVEFGFGNTTDRVSSNFTDGQLLIQEQSLAAGTASPYLFSFTDSAFAGMIVTPVVNTFPVTPVVSLSGTTLTVNYAGQTFAANTLYLTLFNLTMAGPSVPEPASLAVAGVVGTLGLARRRSV